MKKVLTIAIVTILTSTAAFANEGNKEVSTKDDSAKIVRTKESMKLIKKEYKKSAKMFREKALFC